MTISTHKTRLVLATVAALGVSTLAQADDLLSIYREAQRNDASFAAARYGLEAGREKITQAKSQLLPLVGLVPNGTRFTAPMIPATKIRLPG